MVRVSWDELKRLKVLAQRGVDLRRAALILDGDPTIIEDSRHDYGETRYVAVGEFEGENYTVVYTPKTDPQTGEDIVHIINAWRSGRKPRYRHPKRDI
jgi:uncharacterized DUF497 family protein